MWRSSSIFWIIESWCCRVRICTKIVDVQILFGYTHQTAVSIASLVKWAIVVSADWASTVGKLTSSIRFVWFIKRVSMIVSSLFSTTAYGRMISCTTAVLNHATAWAHWCKVSNIQGTILTLNTATSHIAMDRLFARVMTTRVMVKPSLIELLGSNLTERILVFCRSCSEVTAIALVDWVACTTRCSLLS